MKHFQVTSLIAAVAAIALQLMPVQQADARYHHHNRAVYINNGYGYGGYGNSYGYNSGYVGGYGNGYGYGGGHARGGHDFGHGGGGHGGGGHHGR